MQESELRALVSEALEQLSELVPDQDQRALVEVTLRSALSRPEGEAKLALIEAVRSDSDVRDWANRDRDRGLSALPGNPTSLLGVLFICPRGDYEVVRERLTSQILHCPNDGAVLDRLNG